MQDSHQVQTMPPVNPQGTPLEFNEPEGNRMRHILKPLVFGFILVLLIAGSMVALFTRKQADQMGNNSQVEETTGVQTNSDSSSAMSPKPVATTTQTIFRLPVDVQWQDQEILYDVQSAYVITNQLDAILPGIAEDSVLVVFEAQIRDTRSFGEAKAIPVRNYINIRYQSKDVAPLGQDTQTVLPGGNAIAYVPFSVPIAEKQIWGLLGDLRNPYVRELDLNSGEQLSGGFDLVNGFQTPESAETQQQGEASASSTVRIPEAR